MLLLQLQILIAVAGLTDTTLVVTVPGIHAGLTDWTPVEGDVVGLITSWYWCWHSRMILVMDARPHPQATRWNYRYRLWCTRHTEQKKNSWRKGYARQRRHSKMALSRHLGYYRTGNSAIRSVDPKNPCLEPQMEWIGCTVCEIFAFKLYCDLETGVRGHSRSLKVAPWDRPTPKTSY